MSDDMPSVGFHFIYSVYTNWKKINELGRVTWNRPAGWGLGSTKLRRGQKISLSSFKYMSTAHYNMHSGHDNKFQTWSSAPADVTWQDYIPEFSHVHYQ